MPTLIVLFDLHDDADVAAYEEWARTTDLPTVAGFDSVDSFGLHRVTGLFGTDAPPPYRYVEVVDINDLDGFYSDVSGEAMQRVAAEFRTFASDPVFLLTERIATR
jgi:hypothetical protein